MIRDASTLVLQLQQPPAVLLAAARLARPGARVVLDGVPGGEVDALLAAADVLRADAREAELLVGRPVDAVDVALAAGRSLLARGPSLVAWRSRARPPPGVAGRTVRSAVRRGRRRPDRRWYSFVAGLVAALEDGAGPEEAGGRATATSGSTVQRLGGRPDLRA